jgi:predicted nucleic acid-binding protein
MIVVSDASPLIILAKLDRLHLLAGLFDTEITVLRCVVSDVLGERAGILERQRLEAFFESDARIVEFSGSDLASRTLGASDQSWLTYCEQNKADWLVADERLLRRIAKGKGIAVIGTMGILLEAVRRNILSRSEAKQDVQKAVGEHGLRISVVLYQRILQEIE